MIVESIVEMWIAFWNSSLVQFTLKMVVVSWFVVLTVELVVDRLTKKISVEVIMLMDRYLRKREEYIRSLGKGSQPS